MSNIIKLVTWEWATYNDTVPYEIIETKGNNEYEFEIDKNKLMEILNNNNYFNNYYKDFKDFMDNYDMEHSYEIYQQIK